MFGQRFNFKVEEGEDEMKTCMGSFCSLIFLLLVVSYTFFQFIILMEAHHMASLKMQYADTDELSYESDGFNIAIALSSYGDVTKQELDSTYGEITFHSSTWGTDEADKPIKTLEQITSHHCSARELNIGR